MAVGVVLLVAGVLARHGVLSGIPPKFIKTTFGVQKALYAKDFGYSLVPIPTYIQRQAHPPNTLPLVGQTSFISSRKGRGYKHYRIRGPPRRRKRPSAKRRRPPYSYGVPIYATKYKNYVPSRRPFVPYGRYKKRHPYRSHSRRPHPYVDIHHDYYEQEIPDDYEDYDGDDRGEYSYYDIPTKRLPLRYDKELESRYRIGQPRKRPNDGLGEYSAHKVRSRIRYQISKGGTQEKENAGPQEDVWPGEVTSVNSEDSLWGDRTGGHFQDTRWKVPSESESYRMSWRDIEPVSGHDVFWNEESRTSPAPSRQDRVKDHVPYEWHDQPRPQRLDHQWEVYHPPAPQQWTPRTTSSPEIHGWAASLNTNPPSAGGARPSNHKTIYTQQTTHDRPRYQAHYSEADFSYRDDADRKSSEGHKYEPDIGFDEGMELVDDGASARTIQSGI